MHTADLPEIDEDGNGDDDEDNEEDTGEAQAMFAAYSTFCPTFYLPILQPLSMFGGNYCCFNSFLQVSFMLIYIFYFLLFFKALDLVYTM